MPGFVCGKRVASTTRIAIVPGKKRDKVPENSFGCRFAELLVMALLE